MLRKLVVAGALAAGAMLAGSPASALPVDRGIAAEASGSQATEVYYYAPRRYYKPYYAPRRYYKPRYYAPRRYYKRRYYY